MVKVPATIILFGALLAAPAPGGEEPGDLPPAGRTGSRSARLNLRAEGGGRATESAVDAGLAWLARHQSEDGAWYPSPSGDDEYATIVTSLALLSFLGAEETERHDVHGPVVRRGLDWLAALQSEAGRFGPACERLWLFDHAVATIVMSEAAGLSGRAARRRSAQRAIDFLLAARSPAGGFGNDFAPAADDPGVSFWAFWALLVAPGAGLRIPEGIFGLLCDRTAAWQEAGTRPAGPLFPLSPGALGAGFVFCRESLRHERDYHASQDPALTVARALLEGRPTVGEWLVGTLGVFRAGGDAWRDWNTKMKETLLPLQEKEGPDAGSWDPAAFGEGALGRAGTTAAFTTCFEIYYLYGR